MGTGLDKFDLYTLCVQDPPRMAEFLEAVHDGSPCVLRDDFAGPGAIARAWAARSSRHRGVAVDVDEVPLRKAKGARRVKRVVADVLRVKERADVICGLNFGVCELHERRDLVKYLVQARRSLHTGGVLVCDLYGGSDSFTRSTTRRTIRVDGRTTVKYSWVQEGGDATTCRVRNRIHFDVQQGKTVKSVRDAFVYDWRLWSIPELSDAMKDAGFGSVEVHDRLGAARDADGNLHVRALQPGESLDDPYVVYVVGRK